MVVAVVVVSEVSESGHRVVSSDVIQFLFLTVRLNLVVVVVTLVVVLLLERQCLRHVEASFRLVLHFVFVFFLFG